MRGRANPGKIHAVHVFDEEDGMWIADIDDGWCVQDRIVDRADLQLDTTCVADFLSEWNFVPFQAGCAHVDRNVAIRCAAAPGHGAEGFDYDFGLAGFVQHEGGNTASGIAAGFHLAAVCVPDAHKAVAPISGALNQDKLVAADAGFAIGDGAHGLGAKVGIMRAHVYHDKIIAEAIHLAKVYAARIAHNGRYMAISTLNASFSVVLVNGVWGRRNVFEWKRCCHWQKRSRIY